MSTQALDAIAISDDASILDEVIGPNAGTNNGNVAQITCQLSSRASPVNIAHKCISSQQARARRH